MMRRQWVPVRGPASTGRSPEGDATRMPFEASRNGKRRMSSARVALYDLSGSYDAVVTQVKDGLAPLYQRQDGFESFSSVDGGNDKLVSISVWNDDQSATKGAAVAQQWVRDNIPAEQLKLRETVIGDITKY
jgi:hypothetical protein